MISEQLEFQISQYVDGTLPAAEAAALEATLAADAEARAVLADFRKLDAAMKHQPPLPQVNWDRLAAHLSDAVAREDEANEAASAPIPIRTAVRSPLRTWWRPLAVAAAVLIAIGSVLFFPRHGGEQVVMNPHPTPTAPPVTLVQLTGPEVAAKPAVVDIAMGSSAAPAQQAGYRIAEDIIYRPPRVVIASGDTDGQDSGLRSLPY